MSALRKPSPWLPLRRPPAEQLARPRATHPAEPRHLQPVTLSPLARLNAQLTYLCRRLGLVTLLLALMVGGLYATLSQLEVRLSEQQHSLAGLLTETQELKLQYTSASNSLQQ